MSYITAVRQFLAVFRRTSSQSCNFYATSSVSAKKARLPPGYNEITPYNLFIKELNKDKKPDETFGLILTKAAWVWKQMDEPSKADYVKRAREITEERKLAFENLPDPEKDELKRQYKEKLELEKANKATKKAVSTENVGRYIFIQEFCEKRPKAESAEEREILFDQAIKSWGELSPESKEIFNARAIEQKTQGKKKEPAGEADSPKGSPQKKKPFYPFKTKQKEEGATNPKEGSPVQE